MTEYEPHLIDRWDALDEYLMAYEWYASGGMETEPDMTYVPESYRARAVEYTRFLDWKYAEGLWESLNRSDPTCPEFRRSQFRLLQGGETSGSST